MSTQATIKSVRCMTPSTGVSEGLSSALKVGLEVWSTGAGVILGTAAAGMVTVATAGVAGGALVVLPTIGAAAGLAAGNLVASAGDKIAREIGTGLPDQLYIKVDDNKVWPGSGKNDYRNVKGNETLNVGYSFSVGGMTTISLWDWDAITSDDNVGQLMIGPETTSQIAVVGSEDEGSMYAVELLVHA